MKILIIEDDRELVQSLKAGLREESFVVDFVFDGEKGSFIGRTNSYDLIILDYSLPKKSGKKVLSEIKSVKKDVPILVLSATVDTTLKIELLDMGADDYMTKPFSFEELLARIRVILRRPQKTQDVIFKVGDLILDTQKHVVTRGDKGVYLTRKEFSLLELLMRKSGIIVSRSEIMESVWNMDGDPFSNTIEAHILNLRKKIKGGDKRELVHNVPGRGYKIDINK